MSKLDLELTKLTAEASSLAADPELCASKGVLLRLLALGTEIALAASQSLLASRGADPSVDVSDALEGLRLRPLVGTLLALCRGSDWIDRSDAVEVLGDIGFDLRTIVSVLGEVLRGDENEVVRRDAAVALGDIGLAECIEGLMCALDNDPSAMVQTACACELISLGRPGYTGRLLGAIRDASSSDVMSIVSSLQRMAPDHAAEEALARLPLLEVSEVLGELLTRVAARDVEAVTYEQQRLQALVRTSANQGDLNSS